MSAGVVLKRSAIFVHRWLGVALCVLFLLWFPSGIGMMYWGFPGVTAADRLERAVPLDPAAIRLSPVEAYATLGLIEPPTQVRLNTFDGRPVYRFRDPDGESMVYADTGAQQIDVPEAMRHRIAAAWARQPAADAQVDAVTEIDQWTVGSGLRTLRPLWKYSWPSGDEVYLAGATGEVVQYTTTASRLGAYVGAIPHWFYFTPLRKHQVTWSQVVIWTSGVGTVASILGVIVGIWMYSPRKRYRYAGVPTSIPYRGQKRWHTLFGFIFGLGAVTWAFSGMLSMDPFPEPTGGPSARPDAARRPAGIAQALRGRAPMTAFAAKDPRVALQQIGRGDVRELEFTALAGEPVYFATLADGESRIVPLASAPIAALDEPRILELVSRALQPDTIVEATRLEAYDAYYIDRRRERPLPVIRVTVDDEAQTRYYIDPKSGRVVSTYGAGSWVNRWLYHGLHSLDFPWLYNYRPLWDIVVITFMVGGTALCVTSLILAWRVLGRTLARARPGRRPRASEDLVMETE